MALDPITSVLEIGKMALERLFPDAGKRAEQMYQLERLAHEGRVEELNAHVKLLVGQMEVNKAEAQHKSLFVAGWRPAVGWTCVSILSFNYIFVYVLTYCSQVFGWGEAPTNIDMSDLWPVLLGMLGISSASRSYDKKNGVATNSLK